MEKTVMTLTELRDTFAKAIENGVSKTGYIVFTQDSFDKEFTETQRTYKVTTNSNYFHWDKISVALWGDCLDGIDLGVRLDWYLGDWKVEYCYMLDGE